MNSNDELEFFEIGEKLAQCAEDREISARGRISELFPYIYQASKRMSTRAISSFLADNFGVKLSAVGISRALKEEDKHFEKFAEIIEPRAQIIARAHGTGLKGLLDDERCFFGVTDDPPTVSGEEGYFEYRDAVEFVKRRWFSLDRDVRDSSIRFFPDDGKETGVSGDLEEEIEAQD